MEITSDLHNYNGPNLHVEEFQPGRMIMSLLSFCVFIWSSKTIKSEYWRFAAHKDRLITLDLASCGPVACPKSVVRALSIIASLIMSNGDSNYSEAKS